MSTWLYTGNSNWTCPKQTPDTPLLGSSWHLQEPRPHTSSVQVNSLGIVRSWAPPPRPHASKSQASPRGSLFQIQLGWAYFSLPPRSQSWPSQLLTGRKSPVNKPGVVCIPPLQSCTAVMLVFSLVFHFKRRLCLWAVHPLFPPLESLFALCPVASCSPSQSVTKHPVELFCILLFPILFSLLYFFPQHVLSFDVSFSLLPYFSISPRPTNSQETVCSGWGVLCWDPTWFTHWFILRVQDTSWLVMGAQDKSERLVLCLPSMSENTATYHWPIAASVDATERLPGPATASRDSAGHMLLAQRGAAPSLGLAQLFTGAVPGRATAASPHGPLSDAVLTLSSLSHTSVTFSPSVRFLSVLSAVLITTISFYDLVEVQMGSD